MTNEQRLNKALVKIEARKRRLREKGITEPSKFGYIARDLIAPLFRFGVGLLYPKSGHVNLGNIDREDIKRLTKGQPVIYAPAHRSVFDAPRFVAHVLPHNYLITGGEIEFYCTINEFLLNFNGIIYFDRDDPEDRRLVIERASRILKSNRSITHYPEGVYNFYSRGMLKMHPGIIKIALNTGAVIVPIGNELHIIRDKKSNKIVGDISYTMFEDYHNGQSLFRPSDDVALEMLHHHLKDISFVDIVDNKMESFIKGGKFVMGDVVFDLEEKLSELLTARPILRNYIAELPVTVSDRAREYLMRCAVLWEYNKRLINALNTLQQRMTVLSDKIIAEIDKRHPVTQEEHERNHREYIEYWLDVVEIESKKPRQNAYDAIDKYINRVTNESVIESETRKIIKGLEMVFENHK